LGGACGQHARVHDTEGSRRPLGAPGTVPRRAGSYLRRRLSGLSAGAGLSERVRAALLDMIPSGLSSADDVADKLAVSRRTLQRRLEQGGTRFKTLLASVREQLARHYIVHSDLPYNQISFLLGYQDPNSFFRAFHAWAGMTPDAARALSQVMH
jgi:AraC-like DNA-binding protein